MDKDKKIIVTIDREFGSGGHDVGSRLAEKLGIAFYDENLIQKASKSTGYVEDYIRNNDEKAPDFSFESLFNGYDPYQSSPYDKIQAASYDIIRGIADEGSCVILGRAADYILHDVQHVSVFIFAPFEDRVQRNLILSEQAGIPNDEHSMIKQVRQIDKQRRKYYEFYTDNKWGARDVYDLLINTSRTGVDGAVEIIETYINASRDKDLLSDLAK